MILYVQSRLLIPKPYITKLQTYISYKTNVSLIKLTPPNNYFLHQDK